MSTRWQVGPGSRVLQFASFTFDVSVMDMFMPLLSGGTLVLAAPDTLHSPPRLAALLRQAQITFTGLPPAVLNLLPGGDYPDLRTIMAAGEELPAELARRWIRPGLRLVNGYGPTEATVIAAQAEITARTPMPPPIGYPVHPNYHAYVLDAYLNPVPVGVTGELHLGGAGLARGYLNRPELTAERFVRAGWGERLYKTGDLVKRRPDGMIVYLGRTDSQVKIHGVRIELGEIEAALLTHPVIAQAAVTAVAGPGGGLELAAYFRARAAVSGTEVRDHLARCLPAAMVPAHFITLESFPLNPSGKIDRKALPAPEPAAAAGHVPPATLLEMLLADIYAGLLGVAQVGATDSFFDLGGSSVRAMGLVGALDAELDVDVGPAAVFLAPTPRRLAALLRTEHGLDDQDLDDQGLDDQDLDG
jgi:acyl-coenzyme A synthetase/AMP-(fatty) acid ligase